MPLPSHLLCCQLQKKHSHSCVQMQMSNSKKKDHSFQEAVLNLHIVKSLFFYHWNILVLQSSSSLLFSSSSLFSFLTFKEIIFFKNPSYRQSCQKERINLFFPYWRPLFCSIYVTCQLNKNSEGCWLDQNWGLWIKFVEKKVKALSWRNLGFRLLFSHYGCIESF